MGKKTTTGIAFVLAAFICAPMFLTGGDVADVASEDVVIDDQLDLDALLDDVDTDAPAAEAPATDSDVPIVDVPEVDVPEVDVPEVDVPEVDVPAVDVPEVDVPEVDVPAVDVPEVDVPEVDVPAVDVPEVDVPEVDVPAVDVPEVDAPAVDVPEVDIPTVDVPAVDVPVVDVPAIDDPVADVPEPADDGGERSLDDLLSDDSPVALDDLLVDDPLAPADDPLAPTDDPDDLVGDPLLPDLGDLGSDQARQAVEDASASDLLGTISDQNEPSTSDFIESEVQAERARREAQLLQGISNLKLAHQHFDLRQYDTASLLYEEAIKNLGKNPRTIELWAQAREGFGKSKYRVALGMFKSATGTNDLDKAAQEVEAALRHDTEHIGAQKLKKEIEEAYERILKKIAEADRIVVVPRPKQDEYRDRMTVINRQLKIARDHILTREFRRAKELLESVLAIDPVNGEAIRLLHHISSRRHQMAREERDATIEDMMFNVTDRWNPNNYSQIISSDKTDNRQSVKITNKEKIEIKLRNIIIPSINFRDANLDDVVDFLVIQSRENDSEETDPDKRGVNIVLKKKAGAGGGGGAEAAAPVAEDPFAVGGGDPFAVDTPAAGGGGGGPAGKTITFSARYINLLDALGIICDMTDMKYRINQSFIFLVPKDEPDAELINRTYTVEPVLMESLRTAFETVRAAGQRRLAASEDPFAEFAEDAGGGGGGEEDMQGMFERLGVEWPKGSQIAYVDSLNKLFVANTIDNLNKLEKVLVELDVVPKQIEIETRFVEVSQHDLDALGFEWMLTDNWDLANRKATPGRPFTRNERIIVNQNNETGGFTKGNRFWGVGDGIDGPQFGGSIGMLGDIATFSSVLTNPELTMVLHALEQSGRADTLSAPRITTMPGVDAEIKVVTEYIYPTEFEVTPVTGTSGGGQGGGPVTQTITGGIVEPSAFETREVGVILQVTPDVSNDGARITLQMSPEVVTEPEWFEYGSIFTDSLGNQTVLSMRQPFFHSRRLTTTITIYDGATVVMGGMITEAMTTIDDKIPILGDIPGLGTFFSSKAENSVKRNLLIFVTARLVDPAGRPLKRVEDSEIINPLKAGKLAGGN